MARSEDLPIYKAGYDLCLYFEQVARICREPSGQCAACPLGQGELDE